MDRRQRKTREAIFSAFTELLSEKSLSQITVGEIIERADVGRATFYAHFETKDFLLRELCAELFCHVFDASGEGECEHRHIFHCDRQGEVFLHLFEHLKKNDNHILDLLASEGNDLFLRYFKDELYALIENRNDTPIGLPKDFWVNHVASSFVEAVRWWHRGGMALSPEEINEYFTRTIN